MLQPPMNSDATGIRLERSRAVLLLLLTVGFAALSLWLFRENRILQRDVENLTQPAVNSWLPTLSGYRPDGSQTQLTFAAERRGTLLLVFSKACPACDKMWPAWQSAIRRIDSAKLRVIYIDLSAKSDSSYLLKHGVDPNAVLSKPDRATAFVNYRLLETPETILTSPGGRVKQVWAGLLDAGRLAGFMGALPSRERSIGGGAP